MPTNLIVFQFNPDQMTRSFRQDARPGSGRPEAQVRRHRAGAAAGRELLAVGRARRGRPARDARTRSRSRPACIPTLAALELLLYPNSTVVILNKVLAATGMSLHLAAEGPARPARLGAAPRRARPRDLGLDQGGGLRPAPEPDPGEGRPRPRRALTEAELRRAGAPFDTLGLVNLIAKEVLSKTNVVSGALEIESSISF